MNDKQIEETLKKIDKDNREIEAMIMKENEEEE